MLLGAKNQNTYTLNENVTVTVKGERTNEDLIQHEVIVKSKWITKTAIVINSKKDLIDLVEGIDLEENQTSLGL